MDPRNKELGISPSSVVGGVAARQMDSPLHWRPMLLRHAEELKQFLVFRGLLINHMYDILVVCKEQNPSIG